MTDGISSFVSFIYVDPEDIVRNQDNVQVGFDGGDGENGIILLPNHQHRSPSHQPQQSNELLQAINSFRIDGMCESITTRECVSADGGSKVIRLFVEL